MRLPFCSSVTAAANAFVWASSAARRTSVTNRISMRSIAPFAFTL